MERSQEENIRLNFSCDGAPMHGTLTLALPGGESMTEAVALDSSADRAAFAQAACQRWPGLSRDALLAELDKLAARQHRAASRGGGGGDGDSAAKRIVALVRDAGVELWHAGEAAFATVPRGEHVEHWPVRSRAFRGWVAHRFFEQTKSVPNAEAMQAALSVIEGAARFDGPERTAAVRVAEHDGGVFIDLADDEWRVVRVTAAGWQLVRDCPVRFIRRHGMLPLPVPERGGAIGELRRFVNLAADSDWALLVGYLVCSLRPRGPYPVLVVTGEQGSAKSTACRLIRALIDHNAAPLHAAPRDTRDLAIAANNAWVIALDNVSHLPDWLSDAICRLATGGGFSTRTLYTDDEETIFDAQRPVIINGIGDFVTRGDLADRTVALSLPRIEEDRRRPESELWADFTAARPRLPGALLDAVACALRRLPGVRLPRLPRMADAALWATAAEPALGLPDGAFLRAYAGAREALADAALDASLVAPYVAALAAEGGWSGTAGELLERLGEMASDAARRDGWPRRPSTLGSEMRRIAPELRRAGVAVEFVRDRARRTIWIGPAGDSAATVRDSSPHGAVTPQVLTAQGCDSKMRDLSADPAGELLFDLPPACPDCGFLLDGPPGDSWGRCRVCAARALG